MEVRSWRTGIFPDSSDRMTKGKFIERVFKDNRPRRIPRVAITEMVTTAFDLIVRGIKNDGKFTYPKFGAFNLRKRKARQAINPKTKKPMNIPDRKTILFKPSPDLKNTLRR